MNYLLLFQNPSPLDQFIIRNFLSLKGDLLSNLHISLTNLGLYLMITTFIAFMFYALATNYKKTTPNSWSITHKSIYSTVYSIVINQIIALFNKCMYWVIRFGKYIYKHRVLIIGLFIIGIMNLLGIDIRSYGYIYYLFFRALQISLILYFTKEYLERGFLRPFFEKFFLAVFLSLCVDAFLGLPLLSPHLDKLSFYRVYACSMMPTYGTGGNMPTWWTGYPPYFEQLYHPVPGMMAQDTVKYQHGTPEPRFYEAYRRRVGEIERLIPGLPVNERLDLVQSAITSLDREGANPTEVGISPQDAGTLRYLIRGSGVEGNFVNSKGNILLKRIDTKQKVFDIYRSSVFYAENQAQLSVT